MSIKFMKKRAIFVNYFTVDFVKIPAIKKIIILLKEFSILPTIIMIFHIQ
jgi:hypothetical protein